jgi:hypothetical protein
MQAIVTATAIVILAGAGGASARGGSHGHSHGHAHGHGRHLRSTPANPTVPPSLTPDNRLTGTAPLPSHRQPRRGSASGAAEKRDPQDTALDRKIRSICKGC